MPWRSAIHGAKLAQGTSESVDQPRRKGHSMNLLENRSFRSKDLPVPRRCLPRFLRVAAVRRAVLMATSHAQAGPAFKKTSFGMSKSIFPNTVIMKSLQSLCSAIITYLNRAFLRFCQYVSSGFRSSMVVGNCVFQELSWKWVAPW